MNDAVGSLDALKATDPDVYAAIVAEEERQRDKLLLIASENFASLAVLAA
ncbi:MAG: serine hydroxymethyltransferase, partial [Nitrospirota bacterium]